MPSQLLTAPFLLLSILVSSAASFEPLIQLPKAITTNDRKSNVDNEVFCASWHLSVETNNAGSWNKIPSRCLSFVQDYITSQRYVSDFEIVANFSLAYASSVEIAGDGKDAWIFDVDETLLTNLPYYQAHGFGSETFNETSWDAWVDLAEAPAMHASLKLYNELKRMGFKIFVLTGRSENQRNATGKNLMWAGFNGWERLLLRGPSDGGTPAIVYKSERRSVLVNEGYRIHGSSGDQWSDLLGFALAKRSFKLPNPMYYVG
ncbi:acid phosphatase 1-like [Durio zibethinus]|uniref:Acid phosphatase 1-like n=1 Tax=Durio zibethinus TaxID=66656 RepID=A0A6P5ZBN0_DURZI|nr:acid phosphatase 1-like [Durio zibethinus]